MEETILKAENIKKRIKKYEILKGINFEVKKGEFVSLTGASGSGKSSFLYILGLLDPPTEGEVFLENKKIDFKKQSYLAKTRNKKIGFVFQFHYLLPEFNSYENVMVPLIRAGKSKKEAKYRAYQLLKHLGLKGKEERKPYELSGGEQQRVAIARALANNPLLILADEPTGNLDSKNTEIVMETFLKLNKEGITIVMVTHEIDLAERTSRIVEMKDGIIIKDFLVS
jgi:lipoprotein-releasing system ATP-binding protein